MKKHTFSHVVAGVMLAAVQVSDVFAAGFQINEHSASSLGRAFAGHAAKSENATSLAANPASISQLSGSQLSIAGSFIKPDVDIEGTSTVSAGPTSITLDASEGDVAESAFVPAMFYTRAIDDSFSAGIGVFSNFGLATDYSDTYNALNYADRAEIITITMNPAMSYKISDDLFLGFGLNLTYAEAEIGSTTPAVFTQLTQGALPGNAAIAKLSGDDWAVSWNTGLLWMASEGTTIGLSHRAETKLTLSGEMQSALVANYNQNGSLNLDLPALTELAIDTQVTDALSLQFSANFSEWSSFRQLEVNLVDGTDVLLKQENFSNTWRLSAGVTYLFNESMTLRAGYAYDEGAVSVATRSLSIPDTDRHWFTAGMTYSLSDTTTIDVGYAFLKARDANVNQHKPVGPVATHLIAEQSAVVHILSAQLNVQF